MRFLFPIILIIAAVGLFFGFVKDRYAHIKELKAEVAQYDDALLRSRELQSIRDRLLSRYNTFTTGDLDRLEKILPDNVDNVRLILDIDGVASRYGMTLKSVFVEGDSSDQSGNIVVNEDGQEYAAITLRFGVSASYTDFIQFLKDLEDSLRVADIQTINFQSSTRDLNEYQVAFKTYWLR
jgi:hypothetical protein